MKLSSLLLLSVEANNPPDNLKRPRESIERGDWATYRPEEPLPWSQCVESLFYSEEVCSRECEVKSLGRRAIRKLLFGKDSWLFQVWGTEKLDKADAKASYRNIIQIDEKNCDNDTLQWLYGSLRDGDVKTELIDQTAGMMMIESAYINNNQDQGSTDPTGHAVCPTRTRKSFESSDETRINKN